MWEHRYGQGGAEKVIGCQDNHLITQTGNTTFGLGQERQPDPVRGKLFQAALNGSQRALEVFAINLCGWSFEGFHFEYMA